MVFRTFILLQILLASVCGLAVAQENGKKKDVDSIYKNIETYSSKRKFTNLLCAFLLKPVHNTASLPMVTLANQTVETYSRYEGKIIRHISIVTLDPFGFSVHDTTARPLSILEKSGNALHIKTQLFTIRNQLLIHKNDPFDSLTVKESERLIRSQSYIHDVVITAEMVGENSDSVDLIVKVRDLWSIIPDGAFSNESVTLNLVDKNLGGTGHTFSTTYKQNYLNGNNAFKTYYYIPNIKNTFISTRLDYMIDENRNYQKSVSVERPFFSPLARWAGGAYISQQMLPGWIYKNDTTRLYLKSKYAIQDYWAAVAWQVFKGKSVTNRTTKLIFSGRVFTLKYLEKPEEQPELMDYYSNEIMILSGLGISSRKYVKQSYIFRFGTTEDVPVGVAYGIVGGYELKNHERWYWGLRYSWGNLYKWGYFGTNFEYGTFINASKNTEGALTASINYFTGLFSIGNWKFRQFVKPELIIGINRTSFSRISLNDGYGLNGFNSDVLSGTRRFLFVIQTQSYAPWNLIGFRFGPYLNFSFGMMGDKTSGFGHSRMYPQLGFGVLIRNDYLVISNLQLSFAFYPSIPGNGSNVFKTNPFRTTDFGFPDFIIGKPEIIQFR
ncbi:MAG: hypothetical protein WCI92_01745 [Bacteroidota bacterium]